SMEEQGLMQTRLSTSPWSGDYWAFKHGGLGYRYADPSVPKSDDWRVMRGYVEENPADMYLSSGKAYRLSPAEKYDILMGDSAFTLTEYTWDQGRAYFDRYGKVESWMGIC